MLKINAYSLPFLAVLFLNDVNVRVILSTGLNNNTASSQQSLFSNIFQQVESDDSIAQLFPLNSSVTPQSYNWPFNSSTNTFMPPLIDFRWNPNHSTSTLNNFFLPITHDSMNFNEPFVNTSNNTSLYISDDPITSNSTAFVNHTNNNLIPPFIRHTQQISHTNQNDNGERLTQNNKKEKRTKTYMCPTCHKNVKGQNSFEYHLRTHNPNRERSYHCSFCKKSFAEKKILKIHMERHNKEKPFKCDFCSKSFTTKQERIRHHRTHTGERPFKCGICSRLFKTKYDKNRHQNSCKKKPYQCSQCTSSYTTKYRLKYHVKKAHNKLKSYVCHYCNAVFSHKGDYEKHMRYEEEKDEERKCHICKKGYSNKYNLERHNKKVHPEK